MLFLLNVRKNVFLFYKKILIIFFFICFDTLSHGFGWYSHEVINYNAVFTFSEGDLFAFFKKHIK